MINEYQRKQVIPLMQTLERDLSELPMSYHCHVGAKAALQKFWHAIQPEEKPDGAPTAVVPVTQPATNA